MIKLLPLALPLLTISTGCSRDLADTNNQIQPSPTQPAAEIDPPPRPVEGDTPVTPPPAQNTGL